MEKKQSAVSGGVRVADGSSAAEAAVFLTLTACPSVLMAFADNPFEPHKAAFLWVFALAGVAAIVSDLPRLRRLTIDRPWTRGLAGTAICLAVVLAVSATRSQSPALAWWGSGLRRYGAWTELALLAIMTVTALRVTDRARLDAFLVAVALGSIGPTALALSQWFGVDPLGGHGAAWQRPGSTFGNPLFLAGYLVAVVPLTIACALRCPSPMQKVGAWGLVIAQVVVLAAARSSGPLIALAIASTIVGAALLVCLGHRRSGAAVAIVTAVAAASFVVVAPGWMREGAATLSGLQRAEDRNQGTIAVRALLWQAAGSGIEADPHTLAFGSGPESITRVLTRHAGASLRLLEVLEGQNVSPDRAHSETLDTVIAVGVVGLAVRLALMVIALGAAFAGLGLLSGADAVRFGSLAGAVVVASAAGSWRLHGAWTLALSAPAAIVMLASVWIAWSAFAPRRSTDTRAAFTAMADPSLIVPVAAATVCWLAHYLEIQTGVASIASSLAGAIGAALTVACAARIVTPAAASPTRAVRIDHGMAVVAAWTPAVLLMALTGASRGATASTWIVTAVTWCVAAIVLDLRIRTAIGCAAIGLMVAVVWSGAPDVATGPVAHAFSLAGRMPVFAMIAATFFVLATWRLTPLPVQRRLLLLESMAILMAAAFAGPAAVHRSETDVLLGSAGECERKGDIDCAIALYADIGRRDVSDDRAFMRFGRLLADAADAPAGANQRDELFRRAADQLARAWSADPFEYHHARNRGSVERMWARSLPQAGRAPHLEEADRWYAAAAELAPSAATLLAEWANLKMERNRFDEALPLLEQSAALGVTNETSVLCDVLLRVTGIDVEVPGGLALATAALRERNAPWLAALYATRTTVPPR